MKTMIAVILDRSGSMSGREKDVIGGVNTFIEEQKKLPDPASICFVRFDTGAIERFRPMKALKDVKPLTPEEYQPAGGTPLLDAVGQTIAQLDNDWKTEKPDRAIVVIVTDGEENSSREYTKEKVRSMITSRQDSQLWAFIYLGANVDAFAEAGSYGILHSNTAGFTNTAAGTQAAYMTASASVGTMRSTGHTVAHNLGGNIKEDGSLSPDNVAAAKRPQKESNWIPPEAKTPATWTPPA